MKKSLKIALLGLGRAGGFHLQSLRRISHADAAVVFDTDKAKAEAIATEENCVAAVSMADAIERESIDAVIVATPTDTHEPYVLAALEAGKPVLTEKPLARKLSQIDNCFRLAQERKLPLFVAFQRRFDRSFREFTEAVHNGMIGQLQYIRSVSRDNPVPKADYLAISGGIYHDCVVHDLDMVCHVARQWPTEVSAFGSCFLPEVKKLDDHDNLVANLAFPDGLVASIDVNRRSVFGYDQRLEAFGDGGMLTADNQHRSTVTIAGAEGFRRSPIEYSFPTRYEDAYRNELEQFLKCVRGSVEVPITHEAVRMNHRLACGLETAARERCVVRVAEILDD